MGYAKSAAGPHEDYAAYLMHLKYFITLCNYTM